MSEDRTLPQDIVTLPQDVIADILSRLTLPQDIVTLPQDVVAEILSRLPVKSLFQFKCVSPSWNSIISSPHLAKTHLNRTKTQSPKYPDQKIIVCSNYLHSIDFAGVNPIAKKLDFPMVDQHAANTLVRVLSSCDGLLLVSCRDNSNFFMLNPSTKECKQVPAPTFKLHTVREIDEFFFGVGYDSSRDDYKVLMLYSNLTGFGYSDDVIVAVYSLKTNDWQKIQDSHYRVVGSHRGAFLKGCLHRICWSKSGSHVIAAFNLADEIFTEVPLPSSFGKNELLNYQVEVVGGCLHLVDSGTSNRKSVWMMEEYGVKESWTKFTIDLPIGTPTRSLLCWLAVDKYLFVTKRMVRGEKLVVYDSNKKALSDIVVCGIPPVFTFGGTYVESLVSPHHGGGV